MSRDNRNTPTMTPAASLLMAAILAPCNHTDRLASRKKTGVCAIATTPRTIAVLFMFGADVVHPNNGNTILMNHLLRGDEGVAIQLMRCYTEDELALVNSFGSSAFTRAAYRGGLRWLRATIDRFGPGDDFLMRMLNHQNRQGTSLLMEAIVGDKEHSVEVVDLLLSLGVNPMVTDTQGQTVVHFARALWPAAWKRFLEGPWRRIPAVVHPTNV